MATVFVPVSTTHTRTIDDVWTTSDEVASIRAAFYNRNDITGLRNYRTLIVMRSWRGTEVNIHHLLQEVDWMQYQLDTKAGTAILLPILHPVVKRIGRTRFIDFWGKKDPNE